MGTSYVWKAAVYNTTASAPVPITLSFPGTKAGDSAQLTVLTSPAGPYAVNEVGGPNVVRRTEKMVQASVEGQFVFELGQWSVAVLKTVNGTVKG